MKSPWPTKKLGEICEEIISGDWGTEREKTGSVLCKVIRGTDFILAQKGKLSEFPDRYIDIEKFEKIKLKQGDILVEISGGSKDQPTGRILFWDRNETIPIAFSNFVKKILLNTGIVEPKFFFRYWQFLYFKGITKNYEDRTTNIRNFKLKEFLENEEIPLPPLPIQQKIVKILDTIQEAIDIYDKIIEKTKELKKSLMGDLFNYGAPSFRRGRKLKKTEIGELPEDWGVVRIKNVVLDTEQKDPSKTPLQEIKYIDVSSISNEFLKIVEYKSYLGKDAPSRARKILKENDIIFATVRPYLKRIAFVPKEYDGFYGSTAFCVLRSNPEKILPYFLFYYVSTDVFVSKVSGYQTGSGYPAITDDQVKNELIPLPPLPEQQEIAEILQTIDQKIEIEKRKKELYGELFKTMLNKIINQEVEVENFEV